MGKLFDSLFRYLGGLGFTEALVVILILAILFLVIYGARWMSKTHQRQLDDRQREIDRLAENNREYRERLLQFVDRQLQTGATNKTQPKTEELT